MTKVSTQTVDNRPFWRQKLDMLQNGIVPTMQSVQPFVAPIDPVPLTSTFRVPTIAERVALYTRGGGDLGSLLNGDYDDLEDDDFLDDYDDLPVDGLSKYEDRTIVRNRPEPVSKLVDKNTMSSATPVAGDATAAPTAKPEAVPAAPEKGA